MECSFTPLKEAHVQAFIMAFQLVQCMKSQ